MGSRKTKKCNELIRKRRRKIVIRRSILLIVFLSALLCTLCLKLQYFNISNIEITNSNVLNIEMLKALSGVNKGNNIFYINTKEISNRMLTNPYINDVKIKRKLPNTLIIEIKERDARYYIEQDGTYLILDDDGRILDKLNSIKNMNLVRIYSDKIQSGKLGDKVSNDKTVLTFLKETASLIKRNKTNVKFTSVDINNSFDLKVEFSDVDVKVGNNVSLEDKLNKAVNIITQLNIKKGYIDVSSNGMPVFSVDG